MAVRSSLFEAAVFEGTSFETSSFAGAFVFEIPSIEAAPFDRGCVSMSVSNRRRLKPTYRSETDIQTQEGSGIDRQTQKGSGTVIQTHPTQRITEEEYDGAAHLVSARPVQYDAAVFYFPK